MRRYILVFIVITLVVAPAPTSAEFFVIRWLRELCMKRRMTTRAPTKAPLASPARPPIEVPFVPPIKPPTKKPTRAPIKPPIQASKAPTKTPVKAPTKNPTKTPTKTPANQPTKHPTKAPTKAPIKPPTTNPTKKPTNNPTKALTKIPVQLTMNPTKPPTKTPVQPTKNPTKIPTKGPTKGPTKAPTKAPTNNPSTNPTKAPTKSPTKNPSKVPTKAPALSLKLGVLMPVNSDFLRLSEGLSATVIARTDQKVQCASSEATVTQSTLNFHTNPDGADIFALPDGGYVYASNAEVSNRGGGVYGVEMDSNGEVRNYKALITNTSRNCNGGRTPWNTWVTCEESGTTGQCWQVDPTGVRPGEKTVNGELGGNWEAFAFDARNTSAPSYYITEDTSSGALRRYRPPVNYPMVWESLHLTNGTHDYLQLFPLNGTFRWTTSLPDARVSADVNFPNSEGIAIRNGKLAFVSKVKKELFMLDLDAFTYVKFSTATTTLPGGGSFDSQPDHLLVESQSGVLILSEDGGSTPGMFGYDGSKYFSYFEANFSGDEVTGIAFSPDRKFLFAALQRQGRLYRISRDDGLPFEGGRRVLKWKKELGRN